MDIMDNGGRWVAINIKKFRRNYHGASETETFVKVRNSAYSDVGVSVCTFWHLGVSRVADDTLIYLLTCR